MLTILSCCKTMIPVLGTVKTKVAGEKRTNNTINMQIGKRMASEVSRSKIIPEEQAEGRFQELFLSLWHLQLVFLPFYCALDIPPPPSPSVGPDPVQGP